MKYAQKIGAVVLEILTTGMYTNPLDSVREYIQNASDGIFSAENFKVLEPNTGLIEVNLDSEARTLTIRDNGTGVASADAVSKLIDVGMSSKIYGEEAGFRGIGRLAGIAYCKRLQFITSSKYEDEKTVITFDCEGIRKSISPALKQVEELTKVIDRHTTQDLYDANKDEHFFEVRMDGIDDGVDHFLDIQQLEHYLCQVAPVEYDAQRFIFATKVEKWVSSHGIRIPYVKLLLRTRDGIERQVFKPYKTHYRTRRNNYEIHIKDVQFFPEESDLLSDFWMWYAESDLLGMFGDEKVAGLRFRKNNIAIGGPERMAELFPGGEGRLNSWTIGEIHVLSNEVVPNARRDGFEATDAWGKLEEQLQPFIKEHCKACHDASSAANRPTAKVVSSAKSIVDTTKRTLASGLSSHDEREDLIYKLEKETERIEKALKSPKPPQEKNELESVLTSLKAVREKLDDKGIYTTEKLKSSLDRKQRKVLTDILSIINGVFTDVSCSKSKICLNTLKKAILEKYQVQNKK